MHAKVGRSSAHALVTRLFTVLSLKAERKVIMLTYVDFSSLLFSVTTASTDGREKTPHSTTPSRMSSAHTITHKGEHDVQTSDSSVSNAAAAASNEDPKTQAYLERSRLLSGKVKRCSQELIDRIYERNPSLHFRLLAPPPSHLSNYLPNETKEFYFDFYLVWANIGRIELVRDSSSICCHVKYLERRCTWSRAEQDRLLLSHVDRTRSSYVNGRGMRDLVFETLHDLAPDLSRLGFVEHLIYFDLIVPFQGEKSICHVTLLPCIHRPAENEVLLPFGTLRWYPRSLQPLPDAALSIVFQQPVKLMSIRRYLSLTEVADEKKKIPKEDYQSFARVRAIMHELLLPCTLEHLESVEQLRAPFDNEMPDSLFLPHRLDRNCNVFPAGQYLVNDDKAKRLFRDFLQKNAKVNSDNPLEGSEEELQQPA